jgi:dipeptidyl aminopeptidase/acylaminoacyl peptidase
MLAAPAVAQDDVLTPHDVAQLRSVSSSKMSPDGLHVAYTLRVPRSSDQDDGSSWTELHVFDVAADRSRPFITGEVSVRSVGWLPDSKGITFLTKRDGDDGTALYVIPVDGGEAQRKVQLESSIGRYSLSPDGTQVALVATEKASDEVEAQRKKGFKQEVYEEDWRPAQIWIASLDGDEEPRKIEVEGSVLEAHWSPVDNRLAAVVSPTPLVDDTYMHKRVRVLDDAGAVLAEVATEGKLGQVEWGPDGKHIAMITAEDINDPSQGRLTVASPETGDTVDLLPHFEGHVDQILWQTEDAVMYIASEGVFTTFNRVSLEERGEETKVLEAPGPILRSFSLSADGLSASFVASTPDHPPELMTMKAEGDLGAVRRTNSNPWLDDKRLAEQEEITFTARDGLELQGILIHPLDYVEGKTYPLILYVHGGPEAHDTNGWNTYYSRPGQVAAARGFAVFYINYRGSTGRGVEFSKISQGDPAGAEFDDLVDAVDYLVSTGLVDKNRVGVTGGSYGGYATAWCSTKLSDHFAAGVMFVGISDNISKVGSTDIPDELFYVHARKRVWDDWNFFLERSPIYHAENGKTPLLIMHGKEDPRVDNGQSRELYRHLKLRTETPVRLVLYPGEGHGNRRRGAQLDYSLRMLRWFEHYLQSEGGEPPAYALEYEAPGDDEAEAEEAEEIEETHTGQ